MRILVVHVPRPILLVWMVGFLVEVTAVGCGISASEQPSSRPVRRIVATTGMVADVVQAIAGDDCQVIALMGSGVDPHLYKPTRHDVKQLLDADVIVSSGLMLEGRMEEAFKHLARGGKPVLAMTDGLDASERRLLEGTVGHWDPHVWMNVDAWRKCAGYIAKRLAELDPEHADGYRSRAEAYMQRLADLDHKIESAMQSIPDSQRVLITAHDAFGYFSRRYGIPVRSVQGVTTESEAGVGDVNDLVDFVVEHRVPAIFVESSVNTKTIQAVQEGAQARGWEVIIGAELYSDAMGPPGTYEGTYPGMMDANATRIVRALGGTAPATGLFGKLTNHDH
jgi:manganese/zinc/iron transport system substrate-binding protein